MIAGGAILSAHCCMSFLLHGTEIARCRQSLWDARNPRAIPGADQETGSTRIEGARATWGLGQECPAAFPVKPGMRMIRLGAALVSLAMLPGFAPGFAPAATAVPEENRAAFSDQRACERLSSVTQFAFGEVGIAGTTSEGEKAFRSVIATTNALSCFRAVLANGSSEAKLYALCGLRQLDRASFAAASKVVVEANPKVTTMSGCILWSQRAADVVKRIAAGAYDLQMGLTDSWSSRPPLAPLSK